MKETSIPLRLLLLSNDEGLANLVGQMVKSPWSLLYQGETDGLSGKPSMQPSVRIVILDDQAVKEADRSWLLEQIRLHYPGQPLIYVAGDHRPEVEILARTSGASYYQAKPLSPDHFNQVLQSFMKTVQSKG